MNALIAFGAVVIVIGIINWTLEQDRKNATKSRYYNPNKIGQCLRDKKNIPPRDVEV
jgi:hypothetical protein